MTLPPDPLDQDMPDNAPEDVPEEALGDGDFHADGNGHAELLPDGAALESAASESVDELKNVLQAELSTDTTQHYLNQIGTRPLLSAQQESHFATLAKADIANVEPGTALLNETHL